MSGPAELTAQGNLAANLLREWVTEQLQGSTIQNASVAAVYTGPGVPWPTEFGEHNAPIENPVHPLHVEVTITLPAQFDRVDDLISELVRVAEEDQSLGGRFRTARLNEDTVNRSQVDDADQGRASTRLTVRFTVKQPTADALRVKP